MHVQKLENIEGTRVTFTIIDDNFIPFSPADEYLRFLENTGKSPLTVRSYAYHLRVFLDYCDSKKILWREIKTAHLAEYLQYLQVPQKTGFGENVISFPADQTARRTERTINVMLSSVISFYEYHAKLSNVSALNIYEETNNRKRGYKPFLHHISKGKLNVRNTLKLKTSKLIPKTIALEELKKLLAECRNLRDKFLLSLLYESGLRIGQALGLRHEDIHSFDNEIIIVARNDNVNFARAKTRDSYTVHISKELMELYTDYLINEFGETESDYVFVNLWSKPLGRPLRYQYVNKLFLRLRRKTGVEITPHKLRHTHATEYLRQTKRVDLTQRRLGHASIQTTSQIYTHIDNDDLKQAHQEFLEKSQIKEDKE